MDVMNEVKKCGQGKHQFIPSSQKHHGSSYITTVYVCQKCLLAVDKRQFEIANNSYRGAEQD